MLHLRLAALCIPLSLSPAQAPPPQFGTGSLADLDCRIVASKPVDEFSQLLTVEVRNQGTVDAEPLAFRIELPAKPPAAAGHETFHRAQLPHVGRHGRPTPAGGKQTYVMTTWLTGKKAQLAVRVASASFVTGGSVAKPALGIGKPEQVQRTSLAGTFPVTQVRVDNPLERDVDVLLQVRFEQPRDVTDLVGLRLEAKATRTVVFATRPGKEVFLDPEFASPGCAMKATQFEVVDWCLVGDAPPDAGIAALRTAYEAWYRWPEAAATATGAFRYEGRHARPNAPGAFDDFRIRGRFTLTASGDVDVELLEGKGANVAFLLRDMLANVRRPDFATLAQANRLEAVAGDRVAIIGPGWELGDSSGAAHKVGGAVKATESPDLQVQDDRIVSDGRGASGRTQWEMRNLDGGFVVTRRHDQSTDARYGYAVAAGRVVPATMGKVVKFGDNLFSAEELVLTDVVVGGEAPVAAPALPTGPGADALRAAWDASYRLPTEPIVVEAKFTVTTGNDGIWRGVPKLSGTIVMEGVGRHLRASDCRFEGNLARADEVQFAAVLRDRLGMWIARDFNDRAPFDEFFRGAVIAAADAQGTFAVERGPVAAVLTSGGLVRGFRGRDGGSTAFTYGKFGDRQAVTRIDQRIEQRPLGDPSGQVQRWEAATHVTLTPVGPHLLPTKIHFERIFGRDWTPETLVFRDPKLKTR